MRQIFITVLLVLFFASAVLAPGSIAKAEPDEITYVTETEEIVDQGDGYYRVICKFKFFVNGQRRATVRTKHKFQYKTWEFKRVRSRWSTVLSEWDFYPNDGYDLERINDNFGDSKPWSYVDVRLVEYTYASTAFLTVVAHTEGSTPNIWCEVN